jgi:hypothetical protein
MDRTIDRREERRETKERKQKELNGRREEGGWAIGSVVLMMEMEGGIVGVSVGLC